LAERGDIHHHMTPRSAIKARGEEEGSVGHLEQWHLSPKVTVTHDGALFS